MGAPPWVAWTARQIQHAVVDRFELSANAYRLNQLRYDLRKLKGHGLVQRDGRRYAYQLTAKDVQGALLFLSFTSVFAGHSPTVASTQPDPSHQPKSKLKVAYHKADKPIQQIVDLLAAS